VTVAQAEQERAIAATVRKHGALKALGELSKLYQHPALLAPRQPSASHSELLAASPKLRLCMEILEEIKAKEEKVLIFSLLHEMQDMLAEVIARRFPPVSA
jgi:SNF2 family DNA or RNA helicase